jgi:hypothetical protein
MRALRWVPALMLFAACSVQLEPADSMHESGAGGTSATGGSSAAGGACGSHCLKGGTTGSGGIDASSGGSGGEPLGGSAGSISSGGVAGTIASGGTGALPSGGGAPSGGTGGVTKSCISAQALAAIIVSSEGEHCLQPDPITCKCQGCGPPAGPPTCEYEDFDYWYDDSDCTCPICAGDPGCQSCNHDNLCDPSSENCSCDDCAPLPSCL